MAKVLHRLASGDSFGQARVKATGIMNSPPQFKRNSSMTPRRLQCFNFVTIKQEDSCLLPPISFFFFFFFIPFVFLGPWHMEVPRLGV